MKYIEIIKFSAGSNMKMITSHNHAPDEVKNADERAKSAIREWAEKTVEKPRYTILQCTNGMSCEAATSIQSITKDHSA